MNLSYTVFSNIQCPIKFYIIKSLCIKDRRSVKNEVGICIHEIYKRMLNTLISDDKIETSFIEEFVATNFKNLEYHNIRQHVNLGFFKDIREYLINGYHVKVEKSNKLTTKYKIFNEYLKLYTKPDILCFKENIVHVIDIKTGFSDDIDQLLYYLWSESQRNSGLTVFKGYVYNTKRNEIELKLSTTRLEILEQVHNKITVLENLYRKYDIKSFAEFATFIDNENINSREFISSLASLIKETSCNVCRFNNICPAYSEFDGAWNDQFSYSKSFSEKILQCVSMQSVGSSRSIYAEL